MSVKLTTAFYAECFSGSPIPTIRITVKGSATLAQLFRSWNKKPSAAQAANRNTFADTYAGQVVTTTPLSC
jgi:hypothetical protein